MVYIEGNTSKKTLIKMSLFAQTLISMKFYHEIIPIICFLQRKYGRLMFFYKIYKVFLRGGHALQVPLNDAFSRHWGVGESDHGLVLCACSCFVGHVRDGSSEQILEKTVSFHQIPPWSPSERLGRKTPAVY